MLRLAKLTREATAAQPAAPPSESSAVSLANVESPEIADRPVTEEEIRQSSLFLELESTTESLRTKVGIVFLTLLPVEGTYLKILYSINCRDLNPQMWAP